MRWLGSAPRQTRRNCFVSSKTLLHIGGSSLFVSSNIPASSKPVPMPAPYWARNRRYGAGKTTPNSFSTASILSLDAPPGLAIAFKASQYSFSTFTIIFPAVEAGLRILSQKKLSLLDAVANSPERAAAVLQVRRDQECEAAHLSRDCSCSGWPEPQ